MAFFSDPYSPLEIFNFLLLSDLIIIDTIEWQSLELLLVINTQVTRIISVVQLYSSVIIIQIQ